MKSPSTFCFALVALMHLNGPAKAADPIVQGNRGEIIEVRGVGEADVASLRKASDLEIEAAKDNAVINAIAKALANQSDNLRQQFAERARPNMEAVRKMLIDPKYGQPDLLAEERKVRVNLAAAFDLTKLKDGLNGWSRNTTQVSRSDTEVVIFFTARATTSTEAFASTLKSSQETGIKEDAVGTREQIEAGVTGTDAKISTIKTEVKNTMVQQADKLIYELDSASGDSFGTGLMGQFTDKGFKQMIPGSLFEEVAKAFDAVKAGGGKPSLKHWDALKTELAGEEAIQYVITGLLDYSQPRQDAISGMWRVDASVSGEIYDISKRIPRLVAALEQTTESAVAPSQEAAKKRAVEAMAPLAADEIISKLKNNNVIK